LRTLATPEGIETCSLTSLRERLIKATARLVRNTRYAIFQQMADAAAAAAGFRWHPGTDQRQLINGLRGPPAATAPARSATAPEPRAASLSAGRVRPKSRGTRP